MGATVGIAIAGLAVSAAGTAASMSAAADQASAGRAAADASWRLQNYNRMVDLGTQSLQRGIEQGQKSFNQEMAYKAAYRNYWRAESANKSNYLNTVADASSAYRATQAMVMQQASAQHISSSSQSLRMQAIANMGKAARQMGTINENYYQQGVQQDENLKAVRNGYSYDTYVPGVYIPGNPANTQSAGSAALQSGLQNAGGVVNATGNLVQAVNNYQANQAMVAQPMTNNTYLNAAGNMSYNPNSGMGSLAKINNLGLGFSRPQ